MLIANLLSLYNNFQVQLNIKTEEVVNLQNNSRKQEWQTRKIFRFYDL